MQRDASSLYFRVGHQGWVFVPNKDSGLLLAFRQSYRPDLSRRSADSLVVRRKNDVLVRRAAQHGLERCWAQINRHFLAVGDLDEELGLSLSRSGGLVARGGIAARIIQ